MLGYTAVAHEGGAALRGLEIVSQEASYFLVLSGLKSCL